jgi:hypothetical protein
MNRIKYDIKYTPLQDQQAVSNFVSQSRNSRISQHQNDSELASKQQFYTTASTIFRNNNSSNINNNNNNNINNYNNSNNESSNKNTARSQNSKLRELGIQPYDPM